MEVPRAWNGKLVLCAHGYRGEGAAIDEENIRTAVNKMRYHGAVPMCGVLGDTELFNFFAAYQVAAQQLAGVPATAWPVPNYTTAVNPAVRSALWVSFPSPSAPGVVAPAGEKLKQIVKNLTGGERPGFDTGFLAPSSYGTTPTVWGVFGRDGKINGILGKDLIDTTRFV